MKITPSFIAVLAFSFWLTSATAGVQKVAEIEGIIDQIDHEKVTLLLDSGKKMVVSRSSIPKYYSVTYSNRVIAYVPSSN